MEPSKVKTEQSDPSPEESAVGGRARVKVQQ